MVIRLTSVQQLDAPGGPTISTTWMQPNPYSIMSESAAEQIPHAR